MLTFFFAQNANRNTHFHIHALAHSIVPCASLFGADIVKRKVSPLGARSLPRRSKAEDSLFIFDGVQRLDSWMMLIESGLYGRAN